MNTVVIGMDFSEPAVLAARWTKAYLVPDARIVMVNAVVPPAIPGFLADLYPDPSAMIERLGERARARFDAMATNDPDTSQDSRIAVGRADEVLASVADETQASLIVTAVHGEKNALWRVLGSTAERLVRRSHTSVLVARNIADRAPATILAAIDDAPSARHVLDWAAQLSASSRAKVVIIHVGPPIVSEESSDHLADVAALEARTREWIGTMTKGTPLAGSSSEVVFGEAGFEIDRAMARVDADLLVIARRGEVGNDGTFMGATAEFVIRNGTCAVLFVAGPATRPT